jgi:hypothetical protein
MVERFRPGAPPTEPAVPETPRKARTSTERVRDHRQRKAAAKAAASEAVTSGAALTVPSVPVTNAVLVSQAPGNVAVPATRHLAVSVTLIGGLAIATVQGGTAIIGLTHIFAGAFWSAIGLGAALEVAKIASVRHLGLGGGARPLRIAMGALVASLMALSSIGSFGFWSSAHLARVTADRATIADHAARVETDIAVQADAVSDFDRRLTQLDAVIGADTTRGRTKSALAIIADQSATRSDLVARRHEAALRLAELKVRRATVEGERESLAADNGPIMYFALLIGADADAVMRWFILGVALLLDPAAVLLLLAATRGTRAGMPK